MMMRLDHDVVRRLGSSHFNYWFGYVANAAWVVFFLGQAAPAAMRSPAAPLLFIALFGAGLLGWTLLEYLLHRFVYHVIPSCLSQGHGMHHASPRELIGVPWWLTSAALMLLFRLAVVLVPRAPLGAVLAGIWSGYIAYCLLHHGTHHWPMRGRYLRQVKQLHQLHHVYPAFNWGFTTHLWDLLFGTYLSVDAARAQPRPAREGRLSHPA